MSVAAHVPVLLDEVMDALAIEPGDIYVDGTFGAGGYVRAALARGAVAYGIDRDPDAVETGHALERESERFRMVSGRYGEMDALLGAAGVVEVDCCALDIGVSSMQIDDPGRGFSYGSDGPLDMRMERSGPSAADLVNNLSEAELADLIYAYGEEPKSRRIARAIAKARSEKRIATTGELARIVRSAAGAGAKAGKDPAMRTFQALRIAVNRELEELEAGLDAAERLLKAGGRLAVVSFHSLEDRIVKRFFQERSGNVPGSSRHLPDVPGEQRPPTFERVQKPVRASTGEVRRNPRAASATLRAAIRTSAPAWTADPRTLEPAR